MWFGTNHGVSSYNFKKFKNWGLKDGLPADLVTKILMDKNGKMWVLTLSNGIFYFDEKEQHFFEANYNHELKKIIQRKVISQILFDDNSTLWFVLRHEEIYSIKNDKIRLEHNLVNIPHGFGFLAFNVTENKRLYANLIPDSKKPQPIKITETQGGITRILYDKAVNIHGPVGIKLKNGEELFCYKNEIIRYRKNKIISRYNVGNAFIMRVYEDNDNNIWLCTQVGGLYKFSDGIIDIGHCQQFFKGQNITNLFFDRNENVWVGSVGFGTYLITNKHVVRYLAGDKVKDLTVINNNLYAGSEYGKLFEYSRSGFVEKFWNENMEIRQVINYKNKPLLLYSTFTEKIKSNKNFPSVIGKSGIIVGNKVYTVINTLIVYDENLNEDEEVVFAPRTTCILKLDDSRMLVGTQTGLYIYTVGGGFSFFLNSDLLKTNKIETIAQDNLHYFVSIRNKGFYVINKKTNKIDSIRNDLLNQQLITDIFIENNNTFWLSASGGCYQFKYTHDRKSIRPTKEFSIKNGVLNGDVHNIIAYEGYYFIATSKGVYKIPVDYKMQSPKSTIYIEKLTSKNGILLNRPVFMTRLNLSKTDRTIEVEFANSTTLKSDPAYRYRLVKNNQASEWNYTNAELIQLNNLTNGQYRLEVSNGNSNTAMLNFIIPPLFKETIWYTLLLFLVFLFIAGTVVYEVFRVQKSKRNLAESRLLAMQTKLNPHFIFNSLNSMQHILFDKDFETSNRYLTAFSGLMRKCFEFADKDFITLNEELKFIGKYIEIEQLKRKFNYTLNIDVNADIFKTQIPPLFLQPLIENCIKHGFKNNDENYSITVSIKLKNKSLIVELENNGITGSNVDFTKKDGSLDVLYKRIEHLKWIYKDKTYSLNFISNEGITKTILILPYKLNY